MAHVGIIAAASQATKGGTCYCPVCNYKREGCFKPCRDYRCPKHKLILVRKR